MKFFYLLLFLPLLSFADEAEELAKEMETMQKDVLKATQTIQQKVGGAPAMPGLSTEGISKIKDKLVKLASDETFLKSAQEVWASPQRNNLLIAQGVFFLVMILFKAWRQSKSENWFWKFLVGCFLNLVTWVGLVVVIPVVVLGDPYWVILKTLWKTFTD